MLLTCDICGGQLAPPADRHYSHVEGWERPGKGIHGKSGSSLVLRHHTGKLACSTCITSELAGIAPTQMALTAE